MADKHPGGRPSEYGDYRLTQAQDYLKCFSNPAAVMPFDEVVPTVEGMAYYLRVGRATLYRWAEAHEEFRDTLDELKELQAILLQSKGLQGKFAPVITKLMLSANHGMAEKQENKNENSGVVEIKILKD